MWTRQMKHTKKKKTKIEEKGTESESETQIRTGVSERSFNGVTWHQCWCWDNNNRATWIYIVILDYIFVCLCFTFPRYFFIYFCSTFRCPTKGRWAAYRKFSEHSITMWNMNFSVGRNENSKNMHIEQFSKSSFSVCTVWYRHSEPKKKKIYRREVNALFYTYWQTLICNAWTTSERDRKLVSRLSENDVGEGNNHFILRWNVGASSNTQHTHRT